MMNWCTHNSASSPADTEMIAVLHQRQTLAAADLFDRPRQRSAAISRVLGASPAGPPARFTIDCTGEHLCFAAQPSSVPTGGAIRRSTIPRETIRNNSASNRPGCFFHPPKGSSGGILFPKGFVTAAKWHSNAHHVSAGRCGAPRAGTQVVPRDCGVPPTHACQSQLPRGESPQGGHPY